MNPRPWRRRLMCECSILNGLSSRGVLGWHRVTSKPEDKMGWISRNTVTGRRQSPPTLGPFVLASPAAAAEMARLQPAECATTTRCVPGQAKRIRMAARSAASS
eukprot:scaffold151379_cov33-Tisochrysis_lutea.AAC.1